MDPQDKTRFEIQGKSSVKYHLKANHSVEAKRWVWTLTNAMQYARDEDKAGHQSARQSLETLPGPRSNSLDQRAHDVDASRTMEESSDDGSEHHAVKKDTFEAIAASANLQLDMLSQVSRALQVGASESPEIFEAISTCSSAVAGIRGLIEDLSKVSRDREADWQARFDHEVHLRHVWEDTMAKVAKEQEDLESRIDVAENRRKQTKKALKEVLEQQVPSPVSLRESISTNEQILNDDSDAEEFFDAVDAGEVKILTETTAPESSKDETTARARKKMEIEPSFRGYEDPPRTTLAMTTDDRPKISLWVRSFFHSYALSTISTGTNSLKDLSGLIMVFSNLC